MTGQKYLLRYVAASLAGVVVNYVFQRHSVRRVLSMARDQIPFRGADE